MNEYRDENGHWTSKENDGGKCNHEGGSNPKTEEFDATTDDDFKLESEEKESKGNSVESAINNHKAKMAIGTLRKYGFNSDFKNGDQVGEEWKDLFSKWEDYKKSKGKENMGTSENNALWKSSGFEDLANAYETLFDWFALKEWNPTKKDYTNKVSAKDIKAISD